MAGAHELTLAHVYSIARVLIRPFVSSNLPVTRFGIDAHRIREAQIHWDAVVGLVWDDSHGHYLITLGAFEPIVAMVADGDGY